MTRLTKGRLLSQVQERFPQLLSTAQSLIGAPSPNPPGDVSAVAATAARLIREFIPSAEISTHDPAPGLAGVVAEIRSGRPGKTLLFTGRLDTLPLGDLAEWTVPPLQGVLSSPPLSSRNPPSDNGADDNGIGDKADGDDEAGGQRLYGRGAADMKGGIAAAMCAASVLAAQPDIWSGSIVLALGSDHDATAGGEAAGTKWLLENVEAVRGADAAVCEAPEEGGARVVRIGEKGAVLAELTAVGRAAPGTRAHRGTNAIDRLLEALAAVRKMGGCVPEHTSPEAADVMDSAQPFSELLSGVGEEEMLKAITVNLRTVSGGTDADFVPGEARAVVDVRIPLGYSTADLLANMHADLRLVEGVSVRVMRRCEPTWTSPSSDIVRCAWEASRTVTAKNAVVNMGIGPTDARLFREKGIPSVVVGITPYNVGGPNEYVLVNELCQLGQIYASIAYDFLKASTD